MKRPSPCSDRGPVKSLVATIALLLAPSASPQAPELSELFLVVSDRTSSRVVRFDPVSGDLRDVFGDELRGADAVIFGPDQNLYVSNLFGDRVERYNGSTGRYLGSFTPPVNGPAGLAFGPDGDLFVASFPENRVVRFDGATGALVGDFIADDLATPGTNETGGLDGPVGLAFVADGRLLVASQSNHSVLQYDDESGDFLGAIVPPGLGGLSFPWAVVLGPDGHLYVSSVGTHSILRYDGATGAFLGNFVVSGSGGLDRPTELAFHDDGNLYVASSTGSPPAILRYDGSSGAFVDVFATDQLSGPTGVQFYRWQAQVAGSGAQPRVAAAADGRRIVVWQDDANASASGPVPRARLGVIVSRSFNRSGGAEGSALVLSVPEDGDETPDVAMNGAGQAVVVWRAGGAQGGVEGRRVAADGALAGGTFTVSLGQQERFPAVAMDASGRFLVTWQREEGSAASVHGRFFAASGSASGPAFTVSQAGGAASAPAVSMSAVGAAVVVWEAGGDVEARRYDAGGGAVGTVESLVSDGQAANPTVAIANDGTFALAWERSGDVLSRRFDAAGAPLDSVIQVNQDPARLARVPRLSLGPSGSYSVVWEIEGAFGERGVMGRFILPDGAPEKAEFLVVDSESPGGFFAPAVSLDARETITVVFDSESEGVLSRVTERGRAGEVGGECVSRVESLLLQNGRFRVTGAAFLAGQPSTFFLQSFCSLDRAVSQSAAAFYFNAASVPVQEGFLSIRDECPVGWKVEIASASTRRFRVDVLDTQTGISQRYENSQGGSSSFFPADVESFAASCAVP